MLKFKTYGKKDERTYPDRLRILENLCCDFNLLCDNDGNGATKYQFERRMGAVVLAAAYRYPCAFAQSNERR